MNVGLRRGVRPVKLAQQLWRARHLIQTERYDVVHYFGSNKMALFAGLLKLSGVRCPFVFTFDTGRFWNRGYQPAAFAMRRLEAVITSTEFMQRQCLQRGINATVARHGVLLDFREQVVSQDAHTNRVLFWRDPSFENGADICVEVYRRLAPRHPTVQFDLAVRSHWSPVPGLQELVDEHPNVHLYRFPYPPGISLAKLMADAVCVLLPFKSLSIQPQFAVIESMRAGKAVVTTDIDSNAEVIRSGVNGILIAPGNANAAADAVESLINDPNEAAALGAAAAEEVDRLWHWRDYATDLANLYDRVAGNLA